MTLALKGKVKSSMIVIPVPVVATLEKLGYFFPAMLVWQANQARNRIWTHILSGHPSNLGFGPDSA